MSPEPLSDPLLPPAAAAVTEAELPVLTPPWREQVTCRGGVAAALGALLSVVIHRLNLIVGVIPVLNVAFFVAGALEKLGFHCAEPLTRQETTVIQTCAIACCGLAFSGCSASYIVAMDRKTYELIGADFPGNRAEDVKKPSLGWMIGFLFAVSFLGPFSVVAL